MATLTEKNEQLSQDLEKLEKKDKEVYRPDLTTMQSRQTINLDQFIVENHEYDIKYYPNSQRHLRTSSISSNHSVQSNQSSGNRYGSQELLPQEDYNFIKEINNSSNRNGNNSNSNNSNNNNNNNNDNSDTTNDNNNNNNNNSNGTTKNNESNENSENKENKENNDSSNTTTNDKGKGTGKGKVHVGLNLDAEQEFFYLTFFACKILLATQGISHEILSDIDKLDLWNECQESYVSMHEFHDWIKNKLTKKYSEIKEMEKLENEENNSNNRNNNRNNKNNNDNSSDRYSDTNPFKDQLKRKRKISHYWNSKDSIVAIKEKRERDIKEIDEALANGSNHANGNSNSNGGDVNSNNESADAVAQQESMQRYKDNYDML